MKLNLAKLNLAKLNPNNLDANNSSNPSSAELKNQVKLWFKNQLRAIKRLERDDLDLANAGQWPAAIKILSLSLLISSVIFASHWLLISSYKEELTAAREEQQSLLDNYQRRSFQAANLTAYQQQMQVMEQTFFGLLAFLPSENEVPRLLDDIQQQATQQRLEILAFNLKTPEAQNFYTQLPFEIKVRGNFYSLASFMAGISSFDRIVTLHNFSLTPDKAEANILTLEVEAQTYRYDKKASPAAGSKQ